MEAVVDKIGSGLHYNADLLKEWRQRAKTGPYKVKGDAQANSTDGWSRIEKNANALLKSPLSDTYGKDVYKGSGQIPRLGETGYSSSQDPGTEGDKIRDCAFYYLVTGDEKYGQAARTALLAEASNPLLDFSNEKRWVPGRLNDNNPGFIVAEYLIRLLYAYDYIKAILSTADKAKLNTWFSNATTYMQSESMPYVDKLFVGSAKGDYTPSGYAKAQDDSGSLMYADGPRARFIARNYNNRRATITGFVGLAGIFLGKEEAIKSAKRFFKELLLFSIFPDGTYSDFLRGSSSSPEKGYAYATLHGLWPFAFSLAFCLGDTELLDMETTDGLYTSTDGQTKKSYRMHVKAMLDLRNHKRAIYASSSKTEKNRIDGITPAGPYSVWDIMYALPNIYWQDLYIKDSYTRKAEGAIPYPAKAQTNGPTTPWALGHFPDLLFMFGQMEGKIVIGKPAPVPDPIPDPAITAKVVSLTLVNAETGQDIMPLVHAMSLDLAFLPTRKLNVRANTDPAKVDKVDFALTGQMPRIASEAAAPYALFGDNGSAYNAWTPEVGGYTLIVTPSLSGKTGEALTVAFTVIDTPEWILYTGAVEINTKTGELRKQLVKLDL